MKAIDPFLQELLPGFAVECQEIAQRIQGELVNLERDLPEEERRQLYDSLARGLHTLKGTASTLGLEEMADLAHQMENLLAPFRKDQHRMSGELADALLRGVDAFLSHAQAHAKGGDRELPPLPALGGLNIAPPAREALDRSRPPVEFAPSDRGETPAEPLEASEAKSEADFEGSWRVSQSQVLGMMREVERLREIRLRLDDRRREVEATHSAVQRVAARAQTAEVRGLLGAVARSLGEDALVAEDVIASIEEGLKAISTLPLRTVLDPLRRTVRDLSRRSNKETRLSVVGGEVSLDRRLLESLKAPLVHLVRNAVDHGIEIPSAREARGKHREGSVVIRVEQRGNLVLIEVEDDGNGLDDARIREEAGQRGLMSASELAALPTAELHQLIFQSGFTTRREVTSTSGRGVGLDVVRRQVSSLNGMIEVMSKPGQGTRFVLGVAAELGSTPVLMVRCAEQFFGVPLLSVDSLLTSQESLLKVGRNRVQIERRDDLLDVSDLAVMLGLRPPAALQAGKPIMVIRANARQLALAVDEVLGDRDLVIRPLPGELRELAAYQGAAILAQGQLMLVVRSEWLTDPDRLIAAVGPSARRALVVDDSLTARALHRAALESGGFLVHTAASGPQALEQLADASYDVIICDVLMAGMDGLAFTQKVRARPETRNIPLVLVSAHDTEADRRRGLSSGADAFLSKKECASGRLLTEVSTVMTARRNRT